MVPVQPPYVLLPAIARATSRLLRRKKRAALLRLDDHLLADLGLCREELERKFCPQFGRSKR